MTRAGLRRHLSAALAAQGWEYDPTAGAAILDRIEEAGEIDPLDLARTAGSAYRKKIGASESELADVIAEALGGRTPPKPRTEPAAPMQVSAGGNVYVLQMNDSSIGGSANQGGTQITLDGASADELLATTAGLVVGGLRGDWNPALAKQLSYELESRESLDLAAFQQAVIDAAADEKPDEDRIHELMEKVAVSGLGGFLSSALSSGLAQLPGLLG